MANWAAPQFTRSRVKAAGKRLRDDRGTPEDALIFENWRAAHAYVLNTFQTNLRRRATSFGATVAQRLKRRPTIIDKLQREPTMQLDTMHDIAGCHLIFRNESDIYTFRSLLNRSKAQHSRRNEDLDKYDYIKKPKESGYRGVHDIYSYFVSSRSGGRWNNLLVELQFRTIYQHAWATAVEAADLVTQRRIKFSNAEQDYQMFFAASSELIARRFENQTSTLSHLSIKELKQKFSECNRQTALLSTLRNLQKSTNSLPMKTNTILIFNFGSGLNTSTLEFFTFSNIKDAIEAYNRLEREKQGTADVVLVRAENADMVRSAFRNYFSDAQDFIGYVEAAQSDL